MLERYVFIEPRFSLGFSDFTDAVGDFFGGGSDRENKYLQSPEAQAVSRRGREAMAAWRASGRTGQPPVLSLLTKEDGEKIDEFNNFQGVQMLRDKSILGASSFGSILQPKRNKTGVKATPAGGTPSQAPNTSQANSGAFGNGSILSSKKPTQQRTILG